jgi:hypothetical protein
MNKSAVLLFSRNPLPTTSQHVADLFKTVADAGSPFAQNDYGYLLDNGDLELNPKMQLAHSKEVIW